MFQLCVCPRISWLLSINEYPLTWIERQVEQVATRYLKKWLRLSHCASPSCLYLPSHALGLNMPSISTMYKSLQVGRFEQLLASSDDSVKRLAEAKSQREMGMDHYKFRASVSLLAPLALSGTPTPKHSKASSKSNINTEDSIRCSEYLKSCKIQGSVHHLPPTGSEEIWTKVVSHLNDRVLSFVMNTILDVLPHNNNLKRWGKTDSKACPLCGKHQSLMHVLNHCPIALTGDRCTLRHNSVLFAIYEYIKEFLPAGWEMLVDLPGQFYWLPPGFQDVLYRPDLVAWNDSKKRVYLFELTVPYEENMTAAAIRKEEKYCHLRDMFRRQGGQPNFVHYKWGQEACWT